ncbi:MAG: hypothetical protein R6W77_13910 [Trueperaceae bacterium]
MEVDVTPDEIPDGTPDVTSDEIPGVTPSGTLDGKLNGIVLLYLDQNYASRVAKFLIGQASHDAFGEVHGALERATQRHANGAGPMVCAPPSSFHVLETRGGYLLPTMKTFFAAFSWGLWLRPWQEVVRRQAARGGWLERDDLLSNEGSWELAANLGEMAGIEHEAPSGGFFERTLRYREEIALRLGMPPNTARVLPFVRLLARMLAFRGLDRVRVQGRDPQVSDLADLVMAATVGPYVDALATDRYVREVLQRVGFDKPAYSGRRLDVLRLARDLDGGWLAGGGS